VHLRELAKAQASIASLIANGSEGGLP